MKLVLVTWQDAWFEDGPISIKPGTALCNMPFVNEDVGFLVGESDLVVVLAHEKGNNGECDPDVFRHLTTIPKCCIISMKELPYE